MAYETGTAANHNDFMAKLRTFLLANNWTVAWEVGTALIYEGPGVVGGEPVYVSFRTSFDPVGAIYNVFSKCMIGVVPNALLTTEHTGTSPDVCFMLDENPMTYWFFANDRRIIVVAKISTVYESLYAGFFLPYGTPVNYPRPYFIAGTRGGTAQYVSTWRSADATHSAGIVRPHSGLSLHQTTANAYMLNPFGEWAVFVNEGDPGPPGRFNYLFPRKGVAIENTNGDFGETGSSYERFTQWLTHTIDGGYSLTPLHLVSANPTINTWGILQDVYWTPGFDNASENTITLTDGRQFMVFQDTFRTDHHSYFAVLLG